MPNVSIIIPAFHAESTLPRAVKTLLAQTYADWEAVIVSDDAIDYDVVIEQAGVSDPRLSYHFTGGIGTGPANARNVGLREAKGRLIAFLDADDGYAPQRLARMVPLAEEHGAVIGNVINMSADMRSLNNNYNAKRGSGLCTMEEILPVALHTNVMQLFDATRAKPEFITRYTCVEDIFYTFQLADAFGKLYYCAEPLYCYTATPNSLSHSPDTCDKFAAVKQLVLDDITDGSTVLKDEALRKLAWRFFSLSLAVELAYKEMLASVSHAEFAQMLAEAVVEEFSA